MRNHTYPQTPVKLFKPPKLCMTQTNQIANIEK